MKNARALSISLSRSQENCIEWKKVFFRCFFKLPEIANVNVYLLLLLCGWSVTNAPWFTKSNNRLIANKAKQRSRYKTEHRSHVHVGVRVQKWKKQKKKIFHNWAVAVYVFVFVFGCWTHNQCFLIYFCTPLDCKLHQMCDIILHQDHIASVTSDWIETFEFLQAIR